MQRGERAAEIALGLVKERGARDVAASVSHGRAHCRVMAVNYTYN